jgi:hypothetical protein
MSQTGPENKTVSPPVPMPISALTAKVTPLEGEIAQVEEQKDLMPQDESRCPEDDESQAAVQPEGEVVIKANAVDLPDMNKTDLEEVRDEVEVSRYYDRSCCCLTITNPLRRLAICIYEHPNFERITLLLIFANCVTLALFDPLDAKCEKQKCKNLGIVDKGLAIYFTLEALVKLVALGVCRCGADGSDGKEVYFDSKWNTFDFVIVIAGLTDFIPGTEGGPLKSLRTFRILRPLRAINKFPKMRVLVKLLLDTIPMLASVGMLCFLIFFVFGIISVQFYNGLFHQRCFDPSVDRNSSTYATSYFNADADGDDPYICSMGIGEYSTGLAACSPAQGVPAEYSACRKDGPTPLHGAIHYDNILSAWVVLFQIITLEGWVDQMYFVQVV